MLILKMLGIVGLVVVAVIVPRQMRAGHLHGWKWAVTLTALALWLVGLVFTFLHY
jgi:hypothetical protein